MMVDPKPAKTPIEEEGKIVQENIRTVQEDTTPIVEQEKDPKYKRDPYVEMMKDDSKMWHWCLFSGNGRPICMNIVGFPRRNDCQQALEATIVMMRKKIRIMAAIDA